MSTDPGGPTLDDAATLLVQIEPGDLAGLGHLREILESVGSDRSLPPTVQEALGRALWALLDLLDGQSNPAATFDQVGEWLMRAVEARDAFADAPPTVSPAATAAGRSGDGVATGQVELDPELVSEFLVECSELVAAAESALVQLESEPDNLEALNTVLRAFHTVKGTAGYLGLDAMTEIAHAAESLLALARDSQTRLTAEAADLALRAVDQIKALATILGERRGGVPDGYGELLATLRAAATGAALPVTVRESAPSAPAVKAAPAATTPESSIRVRTDRLDRLIDTVGELVIAQSMVLHDDGVPLATESELARKIEHAGKIVRELQDLSLSMRMIPLRATFQRLARAARDVARQCGKEVDLVATGEETELDRHMVDALGEPLLHMLRNAVDHGLETPAERAVAGKPPVGTIRVDAGHAGGSVLIVLSDDGRGLNRERILARATARGLVAPGTQLDDAEVFSLLFMPGFSTAEQITEISGRGVGMDVVKEVVESLHGRVEISSEAGRGTRFTLRLPLTLAITDGMVVRVGAERYILPTSSIHLTFQADRSTISTVVGRGEVARLRDEILPIVRLNRLFDVPDALESAADGLLVVVDGGDRRCALLADELLGQQQVVAKPLGRYLGRLEGVSGTAILGDGRVGVILDVPGIVALSRGEVIQRRSEIVLDTPRPPPTAGKYLTFNLAGEEYGLEILKVHEIIGMLPITRVPRTPDHLRGVINLRGKVIPVIDLRLKLGLDPVAHTRQTCTIVVQTNGLDVGLIVDQVADVRDLIDVESTPRLGPDVETDYLLGVAKRDDRITLLLDIDRVLSTQDVIDIRAAAVAS